MSIAQNIQSVQAQINQAALQAGRNPNEITLVAATKTQSSQRIREAIAAGITICGENRVQEFTSHQRDDAYHGARTHFIGHLQTNKVSQIVGHVDMIESVDSQRLLEAIARQAEKLSIIQDILLEVNIAGEQSKGGCSLEEVHHFARSAQNLDHIRLRGLMVIPPPSFESGQNSAFFKKTHTLLVDIREKIGDNNNEMNCLSMGMSDDFQDAILEGATLVRVGRGLFGSRKPKTPT